MLKTGEHQQTKELSDDDDDETNNDETDEEGEIYDNPEDIITLNIGGVRHETRIQTLRKYTRKTTRLSEVADIAEKTGKREFYFDRQPDFFPYILNFYRQGKLHLPLNLCGMILRDELKYWMIDDKDIEQCCWVHYIKYEETHEMLDMFDRDEKHNRLATKRIKADASRFERIRPKLWRFLQDPYSSRGATVYAVISLLIVILSISVLMIETLPYFGSIYAHSKSDRRNFTSEELKDEINIFSKTTPLSILLIVDNCCNLFFLFELVIKFIAAPYKRRFLITPFTLIEFVCLIPYYVAVTLVFTHPNPIEIFDVVRLLIALRVLRIFRIFILMKHFMALKVLMYTMKASTNELFLLLLVVILGVVIFACLVYYMEIFSDEKSDFEHIPLAFWWALITMTTVGYGDMTPSTGLGYTVGSMCAISGVLVIALSVPAIVQNFTLYYTHAQSRSKLKQRKRKYRQARWTKITELLKMGKSEKPSLLNIVKLAQNSKMRRKSTFVPSSSPNGHVSQPRSKRAHSVAEKLSKRDFSKLLQKHNLDLRSNGVSESEKTPDEEKDLKSKLKLPGLKLKHNKVSIEMEDLQNSKNENLDVKSEKRRYSSTSRSSLGDPMSPKSVKWDLPEDELNIPDNSNETVFADEVDSVKPSTGPTNLLPTLLEGAEADVSDLEEEEEEVTSKSAIKNNTPRCQSGSESESYSDLEREKESQEKDSEKRKRGHKISESEYESSSGKDDDLLDEAYREMKYVRSLDKEQKLEIKKRSNSIT